MATSLWWPVDPPPWVSTARLPLWSNSLSIQAVDTQTLHFSSSQYPTSRWMNMLFLGLGRMCFSVQLHSFIKVIRPSVCWMGGGGGKWLIAVTLYWSRTRTFCGRSNPLCSSHGGLLDVSYSSVNIVSTLAKECCEVARGSKAWHWEGNMPWCGRDKVV